MRTALLVVSVIFAMFNITDYNLLGWTPAYQIMLAMRVTVVASCLVLAFVVGRHGNLTRRAWLHALPLWILATGVILIVPMRPDSLLTQITAVVVSIMAFYLLIPNMLNIAAWASAYLSVGFVLAAVISAGTSAADTLRLSLLLIMTNLVGYTALLRLEVLQRKQFALLHEERDQNLLLTSEITLTVTIGLIETGPDDKSLEPLITRADEMLYVGKREGRNKVVAYPNTALN